MFVNENRRRIRPGIVFSAILVTAFVVGGVSSLAASGMPSDAAPRVAAPTGDGNAQNSLAALKRTRQDSDRLPTSIDPLSLGGNGIVSTTTRLMGQSDGAFFWTGLDRDGSICLIIGFKSEQGFATSSCSQPQTFALQGISVQAGSTKYVAEAFLVPDAAVGSLPSLDVIEGSSTSNLILVDPKSNRRAEVSMGARESRKAGASFPLVVFATPLDLGW